MDVVDSLPEQGSARERVGVRAEQDRFAIGDPSIGQGQESTMARGDQPGSVRPRRDPRPRSEPDDRPIGDERATIEHEVNFEASARDLAREELQRDLAGRDGTLRHGYHTSTELHLEGDPVADQDRVGEATDRAIDREVEHLVKRIDRFWLCRRGPKRDQSARHTRQRRHGELAMREHEMRILRRDQILQAGVGIVSQDEALEDQGSAAGLDECWSGRLRLRRP